MRSWPSERLVSLRKARETRAMAKKKDRGAPAERFMALFAGSDRAHGTHDEPEWDADGNKWAIKSSAKTTKRAATLQDWEQHLSGTRPLGIISIREDCTVLWGSIDLDEYEKDLSGVVRQVYDDALPLVPCTSKSGGLHLFLFLSAPQPASTVQSALRDVARRLGFPKAEVFPKQVRRTKQSDLGNWMCMPYLGTTFADKIKVQAGIGKKGEQLTQEQFLDYAERVRLGPDALALLGADTKKGKGKAKVKTKRGDEDDGRPFPGAPACMREAAQQPITSMRNEWLFNMAVYARRTNPEGWKDDVGRYNDEHMSPPLPPGEVKQLINSVADGDYSYKRDGATICDKCSKLECLTARGLAQDVRLDHLWFYVRKNEYFFMPTGDLWPAASVNKVLWKGADQQVANTRRVHQVSWAPGKPQIIADANLTPEGGWEHIPGVNTYNTYRPPVVGKGNAGKAWPWLALLASTFPDNYMHMLQCFAHAVRSPDVKINHMVVMGGAPGIGKDSILKGLAYAVGQHNFKTVSPMEIVKGDWTDFLKAVVVNLTELRDLGESNRVALHEHCKQWLASPPLAVRVNEKFLNQYWVSNVSFWVATTNHKLDCLYLPPDDRRTYVAWSPLDGPILSPDEWTDYHDWFDNRGGRDDVAAFLREGVSLDGFRPGAPPRKTEAFMEIVRASQAPEDTELHDVLEAFEVRP
jgi:hypothetical protein